MQSKWKKDRYLWARNTNLLRGWLRSTKHVTSWPFPSKKLPVFIWRQLNIDIIYPKSVRKTWRVELVWRRQLRFDSGQNIATTSYSRFYSAQSPDASWMVSIDCTWKTLLWARRKNKYKVLLNLRRPRSWEMEVTMCTFGTYSGIKSWRRPESWRGPWMIKLSNIYTIKFSP